MIVRYPITERGKALLVERLMGLRKSLPYIREEVIEAQKKGDFSENFEYYAAKKHLRELEFQIDGLDKYIKSSDITKLPTNPSIVCFGAKVTLSREEPHDFDPEKGTSNTIKVVDDTSGEAGTDTSVSGTKNYADIPDALNQEDSKIITYVIVGDREAEPSMGSLSNRSPLFQVLVAKKVGATVNFNDSTYTILKIEATNEDELEGRIKVN